MKIIFIRSPFEADEEWYLDLPLGILNLATVLKNNHYDVGIIDLQLYKADNFFQGDHRDFDRIAKKLTKDSEVDILAFSIMSCSFPEVIKIAEACKRNRPNIKILFGGAQPSLVAEETLKYFNAVDYVFRGEGERAITQVVDAIRGELPFHMAPGLVFREKGNIITNSEPELIEDLDEIPFVDINLLVRKEEYVLKGNTISIDAGRGCPFKCSFCATSIFWRNKFRMKSAERIVSEIEYYHTNFKCDRFNLHHDLFTYDKAFVEKFCDLLISKGLKVKWACSSRAAYISKQLLEKMKESGCNNIFYGLESGSNHVLKKMKKGNTSDMALKTIRNNYEAGISAIYSFIIGIQGETLKDLEQTLKMAIYGKVKGAKIVLVNQLRPESATEMLKEINNDFILNEDYVIQECLVVKNCNETIDLIKKYPHLFSHFYFVDTKEIQVNKYIEYANDLHYIINLFAFTLYVLCYKIGISIFEIHEKFKSLYYKELNLNKLTMLNLQQIASLFPKLIKISYSNIEGYNYLTDLAYYECSLAKKKENTAKVDYLGLQTNQITPKDRPYIRLQGSIEQYNYNLFDIIESIKAEFVLENIVLEPYHIIVDKEDENINKVIKIDQFTYDFLALCDGQRSVGEIIVVVYEKKPYMSIKDITKKIFEITSALNKEGYLAFH